VALTAPKQGVVNLTTRGLDMGKGSKRRPTDEEMFSRNYERIFGKKTSKKQTNKVSQTTKR
jgi:hypothetical protein